MSDSKNPFENAPDSQQAFSKVSVEKKENENQEEIIELIDEYDKPSLEFNPPSLDHMGESPQALGRWASSICVENVAPTEQNNFEKDNSVSFANEISDNQIKSEVSLKEDWIKAVSQDNELEL
jgi:hypothetical protein